MIFFKKKSWQTIVPEASVILGGQAFFRKKGVKGE